MKMKAYTVCARAQASIFMVFWPFSRKKKSPNCWRSVNDGRKVVKSKDLRRQTKEGWPFFHKLCEKYSRKSRKYMRNNSTKQKGKKIQLHVIDQSFEHNGMGISYQKKVGKPWREKGGAPFMQAWCQKDLPTKEDRPANSRDVNP